MEQIKIVDKLTLRQEALRMVIEYISATGQPVKWQSAADSFERYIQGAADLPEYVDPNKDFKEMMAKFQDSLKLNPMPTWIPADSDVKPAEDVKVLGASQDAKGNIYYQLKTYSHNLNRWFVAGYDECDPGEVVAWLPIPEYKPTKM